MMLFASVWLTESLLLQHHPLCTEREALNVAAFVSVSRNYDPICVSLYPDAKFAKEEHLRNCVFTTNAIYPLCELKFSPASTKKPPQKCKRNEALTFSNENCKTQIEKSSPRSAQM